MAIGIVLPNCTQIELIKLARLICQGMSLITAKYLTDKVIPIFRAEQGNNDTAILRSYINLLAKINRGDIIVEVSMMTVILRPAVVSPLTDEQIWELVK